MTTPAWQPGHNYLPGDLVQPRSGSLGATLPANLDFALGDTEWTKEPGWSIVNTGGVSGAWRAEFFGTGSAEIIDNVLVPVVPGQSIEVHGFGQVSGPSVFACGLVFYDASMAQIGSYLCPAVGNNYVTGWQPCGGTTTATADAAFAAAVFSATTTSAATVLVSDFTWNYQVPASVRGLIFKAVQSDPGVSAEVEPTWPTVNGVTVVDNTVTWEAVQISRVVWKAVPILKSGGTEPTWPTTPSEVVADGTIVWECVARDVQDENCPHGAVVFIEGAKVYCADDDIVRFCATANPLDWTTEQDAGYLPTGLQQANADGMRVLAPYRGNLAAMNPSVFQMWQLDPDPAAMAKLDQKTGIGSSYTHAAQEVGDDLYYLSQLGVRSIGVTGGSGNLQAGDVGMPIDALVREAMRIAALDGDVRAVSTFYPGAGQYWLAFSNYPADALAVVGDLPTGYVGDSENYLYAATGGVGGHTFAITAGALPPGLSMDAAGLVTGTRTTPGSYAWTVTATDSEGSTATLDDTSITAAVEIPAQATFATNANTATLYESPAGVLWTGATVSTGLGSTSSVELVHSSGGRLFHFMSGFGRVSTNAGGAWANVTGAPAGDPSSMCYAGGTWLLCMGFGKSLYASADGVAFSAVASTSNNWWSSAVSGSTVLAGGSSGQVHRSTDAGATWTLGISTGLSSAVTQIVRTAARFVAFDDGGGCAVSATGAAGTWSTKSIGVTDAVLGAAYGGGRLLVVFAGGSVRYSDDEGDTWTAGASVANFGGLTGAQDNKLIYANGVFTLGTKLDGSHNGIVNTADGTAWVERLSVATANGIHSLAAWSAA